MLAPGVSKLCDALRVCLWEVAGLEMDDERSLRPYDPDIVLS